MSKEKLISAILSAVLCLTAWTLKTVVDLKVQVAGIDARITAMTDKTKNQIAKNE